MIVLGTKEDTGNKTVTTSRAKDLSNSSTSFGTILGGFKTVHISSLRRLVTASLVLTALGHCPGGTIFTSVGLSKNRAKVYTSMKDLGKVRCPSFTPRALTGLGRRLPSCTSPGGPLSVATDLSCSTSLCTRTLHAIVSSPGVRVMLVNCALLLRITSPTVRCVCRKVRGIMQRGNGGYGPVTVVPFTRGAEGPRCRRGLFGVKIPVLPPPMCTFGVLHRLTSFVSCASRKGALRLSTKTLINGRAITLSRRSDGVRLTSFNMSVPGRIVTGAIRRTTTFTRDTSYPLTVGMRSTSVLRGDSINNMGLGVHKGRTTMGTCRRVVGGMANTEPSTGVGKVLVIPVLGPNIRVVVKMGGSPRFNPVVVMKVNNIFMRMFGSITLCPTPLYRRRTLSVLGSLGSCGLLGNCEKGTGYSVPTLYGAVTKVDECTGTGGSALGRLSVGPLFMCPRNRNMNITSTLVMGRMGWL